MSITALSFQHVIIEHLRSFWNLVGHSPVTFGRLAASCLSFIWALRCSKHMTTVNIWLWWREFLAQFHTEWRGKKVDLHLYTKLKETFSSYEGKQRQNISITENLIGMRSHRLDATCVITANLFIAMSCLKFPITYNFLIWFVECLIMIQRRELL